MKSYSFNKINSTQEYAKQLIRSGESDFCVRATTQSFGHGRSGNTWSSPNGGLWFSFDALLSTNFPTLFIGIITMEVLKEKYCCDIKIKWPNDLILNNKKVCGIICEKIRNRIIVGIGINTNLEKIDIENATSFMSEIGKIVDNSELMNEIVIKCKEANYSDNEIIRKVRENMAFIGEECYITNLQDKGKILGISDDGKLVVETKNGKNEIIGGEIINN